MQINCLIYKNYVIYLNTFSRELLKFMMLTYDAYLLLFLLFHVLNMLL